MKFFVHIEIKDFNSREIMFILLLCDLSCKNERT